MNTITSDAAATQPEERKSKRRAVVAFALAALAVGGIGAAATSAAWTDNVFFSAKAESATFNLQGSLNGTSWSESDAQGSIQLAVPATALANLVPGESRTINLYVKNLGSVGAALTSSVAWASTPAATFTTNPGAVVEGLATSLTSTGTATDTDQFQLKVTTDANWAATNQGKSGTIIVTIAGTAVAP
ncbi:MAG: hypothetical protein EOO67_03680 [Microbacterium sp.]|nr:MAG: hypothetical protein EOO67_03680 [Microbacterium sp.]